jgi:hypothetical protein
MMANTKRRREAVTNGGDGNRAEEGHLYLSNWSIPCGPLC